jgi:serine/arginine repetitive matrix protein 2
MGHLNDLLQDVAQPTIAPVGTRLRARGQGHRRGQSLFSGSSNLSFSVTDSIPEASESQNGPLQDEMPLTPGMISYGAGFNSLSASEKRVIEDSVRIIDADDEVEGEEPLVLRRYWALRSEADEAVKMSKIVWQDTPFSVYALQSGFRVTSV